MTWITSTVHGKFPLERASHSAIFHESKMIIFGGYNADGFLGNKNRNSVSWIFPFLLKIYYKIGNSVSVAELDQRMAQIAKK